MADAGEVGQISAVSKTAQEMRKQGRKPQKRTKTSKSLSIHIVVRSSTRHHIKTSNRQVTEHGSKGWLVSTNKQVKKREI